MSTHRAGPCEGCSAETVRWDDRPGRFVVLPGLGALQPHDVTSCLQLAHTRRVALMHRDRDGYTDGNDQGRPPVDACVSCGATEGWLPIGSTPAGVLAQCQGCGREQVHADENAVAAARGLEEQVAEAGATHVHEATYGPYSTGELTRLRHPDQVAALDLAAKQGLPTMEAVVVWLRVVGYELVRSPTVLCTCLHGPDGVTRNPVCGLHGDVMT